MENIIYVKTKPLIRSLEYLNFRSTDFIFLLFWEQDKNKVKAQEIK